MSAGQSARIKHFSLADIWPRALSGGPNMCLSVSSLSDRPSPVNRRVGIHDFTFGACSSLNHVAAYWVAHPLKRRTFTRRFTRPVILPSRLVVTCLTRQLHGWILLPLVICAVGAALL